MHINKHCNRLMEIAESTMNHLKRRFLVNSPEVTPRRRIIQRNRNTVQGTKISRARCVSHTGCIAHRNIKGGVKSKSEHKNNNGIINSKYEERYVGIKLKVPKQGLTSAKVLTLKVTNLTCIIIYGT